jgi:hypothetical protein
MTMQYLQLAQAADAAATGANNILTIGAGALTALGGAVAAVLAVLKRRREAAQRNQVTIKPPVPEIPVTMTRKYNPPTFSQHMEAVRRIDRLEHSVGEIRREAAENYKELMLAGEVRANRLIDKMDDVARAFHARVDDLLANAPTKPKPPTSKL